MNNGLTSPVVTPQEAQKYMDKVGTIAFAWMNDDKLWGPHIDFYEYNIKAHLKKDTTLKIYNELAAIFGQGRVEAYVYQFRKKHREVIKGLKGLQNVNIRGSAAAAAFEKVRNIQEGNYTSDMQRIGFQTSGDIHKTFSDMPNDNEENQGDHDNHIEGLFVTNIEPEEEYPTRMHSQGDEDMPHIISQFSSGDRKPGYKYGVTVVEVDGEIKNPHDL